MRTDRPSTVVGPAVATVFAPGQGATITDTTALAVGLRGDHVFVVYGTVLASVARREADRDADEVLAVADQHRATRAVGLSRGARAIVGALAVRPDRFERVALIWPPGGSAGGRYADWLARARTGADILVIGRRGDRVHPLRVAQHWADCLGARLVLADAATMPATLADFMNG